MIVNALQASCAVATPVTLVRVSAGHSRVRLTGQVMVGWSVSRTVMVWTQLELLPQPSVAVQVRAITLVPLQFVLTRSVELMVTALQVSCAVAMPVAFVVVFAGHSRTR